MLFSNCSNKSKQGDVGEAKAIYEFTRLGCSVSKPLNDSSKYDLIVDYNEQLYKVQVKTSSQTNGAFQLATSGGNQSFNYKILRKKEDWDILFLLFKTGKCWIIPSNKINVTTAIKPEIKYKNFQVDELKSFDVFMNSEVVSVNQEVSKIEIECPICGKFYKKNGIGTHIWKAHGKGKK